MTAQNNETDRMLITKISEGNETAFEEFVLCHQKKILNLIYRYTHSMPDAEELMQDVFVRVWNSARSFRGKSEVFTWLYRIAVNLAINHLKKKRFPAKSLDIPVNLQDGEVQQQVPAPENQQPDCIFEEKAVKSIIENVVAQLPSTQKMAFVLSRYENNSYAEISATMKTSVSSVKSLLFRANHNIRKQLLPIKEKIN